MWKYKGKKYKRESKDYGFVYRITDDTGKMYIGKKAFIHRRKIRLSKSQRKLTGKRVSVQEKDSGWENYWGSSKGLLQYIDNRGSTRGFKREILKICYDKASLSYWENDHLMAEKVLFSNKYWNDNVAGKYFRGKIHQ